MPRPSSLTDKTRETLTRHLKTGMPIAFACGQAGIHRDTWFKWMQRADDLRAKRDEGHPLTKTEVKHLTDVETLEIARMFGGGWLYQELIGAPANIWQKFSAALERQFHDHWTTRYAASVMTASRGKDGTVEVKLSFDPTPDPDLVEQYREK